MQQSIKWARGSARKETLVVGPRHDPYGRDIVTVTVDGRTYKVVSCGLAGEFMTLHGGGEIQLAEPMHNFDGDARARCRANYEAEVIKHTGFNSEFWMHKLWEKLDRARYRRDPEAYELQMQIEEAENRAYGGYM
jgi:hypothetical protein